MYPIHYKAYGLTSFLKALTPVIKEGTFHFFDYPDKITIIFSYLNELSNKIEQLSATVYKFRSTPEHCKVVEVDQNLLEEMLKNTDCYELLNTLRSYQRSELAAGINKPPKYDHCCFRKNGEIVRVKRGNRTLKDVCQFPVEKTASKYTE